MTPCDKCDGSGTYRAYGECLECRGSGEMAMVDQGSLTFQDRTYRPGDPIQFTTTASKQEAGTIVHFYDVHAGAGRVTIGDGAHAIKNVWMMVRNNRTNKDSPHPLHGSIDIRKPGSLF